jgi:hypothetical protein
LSAAQVDEWDAFERRYGPVLVHERIDIGLASIAQMLAATAGTNKPLQDFLPTWWDWMFEDNDEYSGQADEAGQMIATMRAMANKWQKKREAEDGGKRSRGSDNRGRDVTEARVYSSDGGDGGVRGGDEGVVSGDSASD